MKTDDQLRDWFAGQALAGLAAADSDELSEHGETIGPEAVASLAWDYAEAMMNEREERGYGKTEADEQAA